MIIITGGAGFIDPTLAALEDDGEVDVVVCDTFGSGDKWRNIVLSGKSVILFIPIVPFEYLDDHAKEINMIYHLGAHAYTTERDTDLVINTNFTFARAIWRWCAENDSAFVYASSYSTYGAASTPEEFRDDEIRNRSRSYVLSIPTAGANICLIAGWRGSRSVIRKKHRRNGYV